MKMKNRQAISPKRNCTTCLSLSVKDSSAVLNSSLSIENAAESAGSIRERHDIQYADYDGNLLYCL